MRIGILGWYGHQNFGDERILYCLKKILQGHDILVVGGWNEAREALSELNSCDYVLIGGGGLILRGCSKHVDIIERLHVPFSCVGISVEAEHREMLPFIEILNAKADRIIVRDSVSENIFGSNPKIEICPDLTFLYPLEIVSPTETEICGLNLRPWFFWKGQLHGDFHLFMYRQSRKYQNLSKFYPFQKWDPDAVVPVLKRSFNYLIPMPFYFEEVEENDKTLMQRYFNEVPGSFSLIKFDQIRYLIGMRLHAIIFSVQCGIPFLSLSYQPKNIRFCKDLGLENLSVDIFNWRKQIPEKIEYIRSNYNEIRNIMLDVRNEYIVKTRQIMNQFFSDFHV